MDRTSITIGPTLFAVLAALAVLGTGVVGWARLGLGRAVLGASVRAAVQLAAVSAIIVLVLHSWWSTVLFVAVMYVVAAGTSAGRVTGRRIDWAHPLPGGFVGWSTLVPIGLGVAPALTLLVATRAVPPTPLAVLPTAGILIGGAMTATNLAGRRALDELRARRGEYEAGLALGLLDRDAAMEICRTSAGQALIPALDQTRTVGLVTLPGAFVGVLLGGAGPVQAGATQLLILVALLAVEAIAIAATIELVARRRLTDARTPAGPGRSG